MNEAKSIGAISLVLCGFSPLHAQNTDQLMNTPIRWSGVEVVTNDFDSVERIRSIANFPEQSTLLISDPKLKAVCTSVRAALPASNITCSPLMSEGSEGVAHAWYVIEVDIPTRARLACISPTPAMSPELISLVEEWQAELSRAALSSSSMREFINDSGHLDYESPLLSKLAARIHESVKDRGRELETAGAGCDPRSRENAFYLMSFAGDPKRYRALAAFHILDDDAGAANAATRFLSVFADFIDASVAPRIAGVACSSLDGGLTARNKSLWLLSKLTERQTVTLDQLSAECQLQIRSIARTSRAELVAVPARELLERAK